MLVISYADQDSLHLDIPLPPRARLNVDSLFQKAWKLQELGINALCLCQIHKLASAQIILCELPVSMMSDPLREKDSN